jgi:hypothetical protein
MELEGEFLSLESHNFLCNFLIFCTVKLSILIRLKAIISKKLMKVFRTNVNVR